MVVVGLDSIQIHTNPFVINLVLHVRHQNECGHDTGTLGGLQRRADLAVPHIRGTRQHGPHTPRRHRQQQVAIVRGGLAINNPIVLARVSEVLGLVDDAVDAALERVGCRFALGRGRARFKLEGVLSVAASKTEGADTALAVF